MNDATKINLLLQNVPDHIVITDKFLKQLNISNSLKQIYIKNHWLESIGYGASIRKGNVVNWTGGVYAIQNQLELPIHIGGKTALELLGLSHFLKFNLNLITIFSQKTISLPKWFKKHKFNIKFDIINSNFIPLDVAIEEREFDGLKIKISSPERAFFELLYQIPSSQSFLEASLIMENLVSLRPSIIQLLLEQCSSIKVKRIFLFLAEMHNHPWFPYLKLNEIDLGSGKRVIEKDGTFDSKYQITIPRRLLNEQ